MKAPRIAVLTLVLAGIAPIPLLAADMAPAAPDQATAAMQERMQAMRSRMLEIQRTPDPDKRKALMEAQMKDMAAMMQDPNCPADGPMKGHVMGAPAQDDLMARRMEMMRMMMMPMMAPEAPGK